MADNQETGSDLPLPQSYIDAIKGFEGFTPKAEWDYRQHSNGYGTRARYPGEVIDRQEATDRLHRELGSAAAQVDARFPNLPEGHRAALTSLTYNAGPGWMQGGLGAAVGAGDWDTAKRLFLGYNHAGRQVIPGLVTRRASEAAWLSGATPGPGAAPSPAVAPFFGMSSGTGASTASVPTALAPPVSGVQSLLASFGSSDNKGTGTFGDIGKSLLATAGKSKGLPFPDAKLKPFDENLRPLPLNLPNFAAMAQIPKFAEGGVVDRPTVAMVGENGPEAIVPLSRNAGGPYSYLGMLEQAGRFMPSVDLFGQAPSTNIIRDTVDPFERAAARTRAPYARANERVRGLLEFLDHLKGRMIYSGLQR